MKRVEFHVWQRCGQCTMTIIDRDTSKQHGEPLSVLSSFHERDNGQRNFSVYMIPVMENVKSADKNIVSVGNEVGVSVKQIQTNISLSWAICEELNMN